MQKMLRRLAGNCKYWLGNETQTAAQSRPPGLICSHAAAGNAARPNVDRAPL